MFKVYNYVSDLEAYLSNLITEKTTRVVWLGVNRMFPNYYRIILRLGINDISIMDNNPAKHGRVYYPLGLEEQDEYKIECGPLQILETDKDRTLFLMQNSHHDELSDQLSQYGISRDRIIDLSGFFPKWREGRAEQDLKGFRQVDGRELQLRELQILKDFARFCDTHELRYYMAEGTLIGAVRHGGFIPWDDDIDVFMPYDDYMKLLSIYHDDGKYELLDWRKTKNYPYQFAKFSDSETRLVHPEENGFVIMGICIDVFPLTGYPSDREEIKKKWDRNIALDAVIYPYRFFLGADGYEMEDCRQQVNDEKYAMSFSESDMISTAQLIRFAPWATRRAAFDNSIKLKFEDGEFNAPAGYDEYLKDRYGDYMTLPPKEERHMHFYPSYIRDDE